jgi:hypothetical protein
MWRYWQSTRQLTRTRLFEKKTWNKELSGACSILPAVVGNGGPDGASCYTGVATIWAPERFWAIASLSGLSGKRIKERHCAYASCIPIFLLLHICCLGYLYVMRRYVRRDESDDAIVEERVSGRVLEMSAQLTQHQYSVRTTSTYKHICHTKRYHPPSAPYYCGTLEMMFWKFLSSYHLHEVLQHRRLYLDLDFNACFGDLRRIHRVSLVE